MVRTLLERLLGLAPSLLSLSRQNGETVTLLKTKVPLETIASSVKVIIVTFLKVFNDDGEDYAVCEYLVSLFDDDANGRRALCEL